MTANRIVIGVDGSGGSEDAVEWCASIAQGLGADVVVVHALTLADYPQLAIPVPSSDAAWRQELAATVNDVWCKPLREAGVPFRVVMVDDIAPRTLMRIADDEDAVMIVVGTRGRGGFKGLLLGSVGLQLAHYSRRPVTIVPPRMQG